MAARLMTPGKEGNSLFLLDATEGRPLGFVLVRHEVTKPASPPPAGAAAPPPDKVHPLYMGTGVKRRKAWLNGSGPNPRVGLAVRWVESGGNQPPLPATSCGGHNQRVCMSGARCQAGLVEYNGGCYGCGTLGQACCKDWSNIPTPGGWQGFCAQGYCGYPGGSCRQ